MLPFVWLSLCSSRFLKIRVCFSAKNYSWIRTPGLCLRCRLYQLVPSYTSQTESGQMCVNEVIWSLAWVLVWDCTLQILSKNVYEEMQLKKTHNSNAQDKLLIIIYWFAAVVEKCCKKNTF